MNPPQRVELSTIRSKRWTALGWVAIALFIAIYGVELLPHHGPPVTVRWIREVFGQAGLIVFNIIIVLAFLLLLPFRRPTKALWKSQGTFIAFAIALMTEMFGWPLLIFLVSPQGYITTCGTRSTPEFFSLRLDGFCIGPP